MEKLDILSYRRRHADVIFPCLWIMGFTAKTDIWWNVKTQELVIVLTGSQKNANSSCNFSLWTISVVYLSARSSTLLVLAGVRRLHHCMDDHLPAISWMTWNCRSCQLFSFKFPLICSLSVHCPETCSTNLQLHNPCWLANILSSTVKPIIYECRNMTSAWRHQ